MNSQPDASISIALGGDVMTGRGIDQILPHAGDPTLYEHYVENARDYVSLAMQASGVFQRPVAFDYIWGDALPELLAADVRLVNLETSITRAEDPWPYKGINYRMHPQNVGCLTAARLDCCSLANNHVLDWGYDGLAETLQTLSRAGISVVGAGLSVAEAGAPALLTVPRKGRVLVIAVGTPTSGIPLAWAATKSKSGVNLLRRLDVETARDLARGLRDIRNPDDVTVVSIHWGDNWGYEIPEEHVEFAHVLVDEGIDVIHGHSSHHARAVEVRGGGVIFYGCGDFVNDYEGISGHEEYRGDLAPLYRVRFGLRPERHADVSVIPYQRKRMRLQRASARDARWLQANLREQSVVFGTEIHLEDDLSLTVRPTRQTERKRSPVIPTNAASTVR